MGLFGSIFNKAKGQFIDVIEWVDDTRDTVVWKFPRYDNEIKNGAQLIVRESQVAVFMHEGELGDVFLPGRHELTTNNIPILTTLKSWKYAFDAPFKCDIYFVTMRQFLNLKWGTKNPVMLRDAEFGPLRLRAFGTFCFQVKDAGKFVKGVAGTMPGFTKDMVEGQLRDILCSRFADALGESKIPALDLAANYNELGDKLIGQIKPEFENYGLDLTKLLVENISMPEEVEQAIDQRTKMGVIGNMGTYTQMKTAEAIGDMANNPGQGAGGMGMIAGLGMGGVVTGAMQAGVNSATNANQQPPQQTGATPPPMPQETQYHVGIGGEQKGPFTVAVLAQMAGKGEISGDSLVWKQGMSGWEKAAQQDDLAAIFSSPPPLPQ